VRGSGSYKGAIVEGDQVGVLFHPVWAGGDDGNSSGAAAVGGVVLFL
jgi:hypothetical protein